MPNTLTDNAHLASSVLINPELTESIDAPSNLESWANFLFTAFVTNTLIVAVQSPVRTILVNSAKYGKAFPPVYGGILAFVRAMYAGTSASLSGTTLRTVYVTNIKDNQKVKEEIAPKDNEANDPKSQFAANLGSMASLSLGEILITNTSETLSTLKKIPGLLPDKFKWYAPHNTYRLLSSGFAPRLASGIINFSALCILEEQIANVIPFHNQELKHCAAGTVAGMASALFSYPFSSFKDYVQVQSWVNEQGKLYNKSGIQSAKELMHNFVSQPVASLKTLGSRGAQQLPVRMISTGVIFATVVTVQEALGPEPLKKLTSTNLGFFTVSSTKSINIELEKNSLFENN